MKTSLNHPKCDASWCKETVYIIGDGWGFCIGHSHMAPVEDNAPPSTKRTPLVYPVINDPLDPCRPGYDYGRPCGFACGRPYHSASPSERR